MTYSVGFVILAHENLHRVAQLVSVLAQNKCPVVVHVDQKTSQSDFRQLKESLAQFDLVKFTKRTNAEWGRMSLVKATQKASAQMLSEFPNVGHVMLNSGCCVTTRPTEQLIDHLSKHQGTDFIESVSVSSKKWVQDGLSTERFKFYFPFSWKQDRWLFDKFTWLQRKLKVNRKPPDNLVPHLGSQWWCLTRQTLDRILNDPQRRKYDRYFAKTWIPDESYFQTLARKHSERLESSSLTWAKFDADGKPFTLYDDHLDLIPRSGPFMARKVWHKADNLYEKLLSGENAKTRKNFVTNQEAGAPFEKARALRLPFDSGKVNPGRFPTGKAAKRDKTARKFTVLMGAKTIYPTLQTWLSKNKDLLCHGNIFAAEGVEFAGGVAEFPGNISANRLLRNYRAPAFLANMIWNRRDVSQLFFYDLGDNQKAHDAILKDPNAQIILIKEAWVLHFMGLQNIGADTRSKAKLLHASEQRLKQVIARVSTQANIIEFEIEDIVNDPAGYLTTILETATGKPSKLVALPELNITLDNVNKTIRYLRNEGFTLGIREITLSQDKSALRDKKPRLIDG